jgi:predicted RNase H-like HicB family nuclease
MAIGPHVIFITRVEGGSYLAASIDTPRFCVGGTTRQNAYDKAQHALEYYHKVKDKVIRSVAPRETRVLSPVFEQEELCA